MSTTRVAVTGAAGRMGGEAVRAILAEEDLELTAAVDPIAVGRDVGNGVRIEERWCLAVVERTRPSVLIDFTLASAAPTNAVIALENGVVPIIGTSGLTQNDRSAIRDACESTGLGALIVPNFAIGAVLMMRFAQDAARYLPDVEIIEMHHDGKLDAPSATAIRTAEMIANARGKQPRSLAAEHLKLEGARGAELGQTKIHSVRLPGLVAHQMVLFGGPGESLTIRHDSIDRKSFMPGVVLAVRKASSLRGLVVGLEHLL